MKPDGLCSRSKKFQKIVIFVWWAADHPPDHIGARTPKKCTPTILKSSVARPFLWNVGEWVDWWHENGCIRAESANYFSNGSSPWFFYDSHFGLLTHALKMKPDGLWNRLRKFQKIVIFVWWPAVYPPDHMGAQTPKKCTPTILKSSVARPFLWNVGEWVVEWQ